MCFLLPRVMSCSSQFPCASVSRNEFGGCHKTSIECCSYFTSCPTCSICHRHSTPVHIDHRSHMHSGSVTFQQWHKCRVSTEITGPRGRILSLYHDAVHISDSQTSAGFNTIFPVSNIRAGISRICHIRCIFGRFM